MKRCRFCAEAIQDAAVVCRFCGRDLDPSSGRDPGSVLSLVLRGGEIVLGAGAIALVGSLLFAPAGTLRLPGVLGVLSGAAQAPAPSPPLVLSVLESEELDLSAGEHFDTAFVVSDPRSCVFSGRVRGLAGGDRDVEVFLLDAHGEDQWHEGDQPRALFASGRTAAADLEVSLPGPGRYSLLVSNDFSIFTGKTVQVDGARVTCQ